MSRLKRSNSAIQQLEDVTVHNWYRFVLSYPDHLVSQMINKFGIRREHTVLDPFVGTGTILIECKKSGINSVGIDANPVAAFASKVKTTWDIDLTEFDRRRHELLESIREPIRSIGTQYPAQLSFDDLFPPGEVLLDQGIGDESLKLLLPKNWIRHFQENNHPKGHSGTGSIRTNHFSKPGRHSNRFSSSSISFGVKHTPVW